MLQFCKSSKLDIPSSCLRNFVSIFEKEVCLFRLASAKKIYHVINRVLGHVLAQIQQSLHYHIAKIVREVISNH